MANWASPKERFVEAPGVMEIRWVSDDPDYYATPIDLFDQQATNEGLPDWYGKKDKATKVQAYFTCNVCECDLKSVPILRIHCKGKKHIKKALHKIKEYHDSQKMVKKPQEVNNGEEEYMWACLLDKDCKEFHWMPKEPPNRPETKNEDEILKPGHRLLIKRAILMPEAAKDDINVVQIQCEEYNKKNVVTPLVVMKGQEDYQSYVDFLVTLPAKIKLLSGNGPIFLYGSHCVDYRGYPGKWENHPEESDQEDLEEEAGNNVEEEYMWACLLDKDRKEFQWTPEEQTSGPSGIKNEVENLKPGHRLLIKRAILMPRAAKDDINIVQIECEGYNKEKVVTPLAVMKGQVDYQIYVDLMVPLPAKIKLLSGNGPVHLSGSHCVDYCGYQGQGEDYSEESEEEDVEEMEACNYVEEEYMWSCFLDKECKAFQMMPQEPTNETSQTKDKNENEHLKPEHRLHIKRAILMPNTAKDDVNVVQIECEGYNKKKVVTPLVVMKGEVDYQSYVDLQVPLPAKFNLLAGHGPVYLNGSHCVDYFGSKESEQEDVEKKEASNNVEEEMEEAGNNVEEEYMWACLLNEDCKEFQWMPEELTNGPYETKNEEEILKPGHKLLIKRAILMPEAAKDDFNVVQIECEGYNNKKVVTPLVVMKGQVDYQSHVDLLVPMPAKIKLLSGSGPVHLIGTHCVDHCGYQGLGEDYTDESEEEDVEMEEFEDEDVEEEMKAEEEYLWACLLDNECKEFQWMPEEPTNEPSETKNGDEVLKPVHRLLIKRAILTPEAAKDDINVVQIECEGYNNEKVVTPLVVMKGQVDYQTYVDLLVPLPAKIKLLSGDGPIHLNGSHCVDYYRSTEKATKSPKLEDGVKENNKCLTQAKRSIISSAEKKRNPKSSTEAKVISTESVLNEYTDICWSCSKTKMEVKLHKCMGCKKAKYCSRNCIEHDWPVHGKWCIKQQKKRAAKI